MKELIEIQYQLKAPKNQRNNFGKYNYRSCEDILEGLKGLLSEYKCYVTLSDTVEHVGNIVVIKATATITNNEGVQISVDAFAGVDPNKKGMDIAQTFGSSSSYARKYALNGLFAIDDTKDADTQDNTPSKQTSTKSTSTKTNTPAKVKTVLGVGSEKQIKYFQLYRDYKTDAERAELKRVMSVNFSDFKEVFEKIETDYKAYLVAKNK
jgi:hypothetical protein